MVKLTRVIIGSIVGGLMITVCSFIPLLSYLCCLYVPLGGFISAAIVKAMSGKEKLESTDGLAAGVGAGAVAAAIYATITAVMMLLLGGVFFGLGGLFALATKSLAPLLALGASGAIYMALLLVFVVCWLAMYLLFGALGGAICAATMYKK